MGSPYRTSPRKAPASAKFVYSLDDNRNPSALKMFALPLGAIAIGLSAAARTGDGYLGLAASLVAAAGIAVHRWRASPNVVVLRVRSGNLDVFPKGSKSAVFHSPVAELDDVLLETRAVVETRSFQGVTTVIAGAEPVVGNGLPRDEKRITLRTRSGQTYPVTQAFFGDHETTEWFGRIRLFLRSAGWVPPDERGEEGND